MRYKTQTQGSTAAHGREYKRTAQPDDISKNTKKIKRAVGKGIDNQRFINFFIEPSLSEHKTKIRKV